MTSVSRLPGEPGLYVWTGDDDALVSAADAAGIPVLWLETTDLVGEGAFYRRLRRDWRLPVWFGDNLDALFDVLVDRARSPAVLIWDGAGIWRTRDPRLADGVLRAVRDATRESSLTVVLRRDPWPREGRAPAG